MTLKTVAKVKKQQEKTKEKINEKNKERDGMNEDIAKLWEQEDIEEEESDLTRDEKEALEYFHEHLKYNKDKKRYTTSLPWIGNERPTDLPNNFAMAIRRFKNNEEKLKRTKHTNHQQQYDQEMAALINNEVLEKVTPEMDRKAVARWYLPAGYVVKETSYTTGFRIVFDASAGFAGKSLNGLLQIGPQIKIDIAANLMRSRQHEWVLQTDVRRMFHSIEIEEEDRDYLRILVRTQKDGPIEEYRFVRVCFGLGPATFLSCEVLRHHARTHEKQFPLAAEIVMNSFIVDDALHSCASEEELLQAYQELVELLDLGGFKLAKVSTNSKTVYKKVPKEDLHKYAAKLIPDEKEDTSNEQQESTEALRFRALGVLYSGDDDTFCYDLASIARAWNQDELLTRRVILSRAAAISYDPLGILSPVTVRAKMIVQRCWGPHTDWDSPVSGEITEEWKTFEKELKGSPILRIPRHVGGKGEIAIFGFSDASVKAFAATVYVRVAFTDGYIKTSLLISRSRLAPIKKVSVPRLELCGLKLLGELMDYVIRQFQHKGRAFAYTDSEIVLWWCKKKPGDLKTYVANRVEAIQKYLQEIPIRYVASLDNPADIATKGKTILQIQEEQLWTQGPFWLKKPEEEFPEQPETLQVNEEDEEIIQEVKVLATQATIERTWPPSPTDNDFIGVFSSSAQELATNNYVELRRHTATVLDAVDAFRKRRPRITSVNRRSFLRRAELKWAEEIQKAYLSEDYEAMKNKQPLKRNSKLAQLRPKLSGGILYATGRTGANLIILPECEYRRILILATHQRLCCRGPTQTQSEIQKIYWILGGRRAVTKVIKKCHRCARFNARQAEPTMANLPEHRFTITNCWDTTGMDSFGPIKIKDGPEAHCLLFVCSHSRAVHLEAVPSLKADDILEALTRFVARRGKPTQWFSDQHKSFKKLSNILNASSTKKKLDHLGITWTHITPNGPWQGFWEPLVKQAKHCMLKTLRKTTLTFQSLRTLLVRIEGILNQRPLIKTEQSVDDPEVLTPNMFLRAETSHRESELPDVFQTKFNLGKAHRERTRILNLFWKRFTKEYCRTLLPVQKWMKQNRNLEKGDIVMVADQVASRNSWPLARVIETHPGPDEVVRTVTIKTKKGVLRKPARLLHLLEFHTHEKTEDSDSKQSEEEKVQPSNASNDEKKREQVGNSEEERRRDDKQEKSANEKKSDAKERDESRDDDEQKREANKKNDAKERDEKMKRQTGMKGKVLKKRKKEREEAVSGRPTTNEKTTRCGRRVKQPVRYS